MTNRQLITRRQVLATGGAASLFLLAPEAMRVAAAATPMVSVGFVDTLGPLATGMRVVPGARVANDTSLLNRLLDVSVGGLHPSTDAAFPVASLDALFPAGGKEVPFYALTHRGGATGRGLTYSVTPGTAGLRFALKTAGTTATTGLGPNRANGLRTGTYLLALAPGTWSTAKTLANRPAQRSLVVVIRPA